MPCIAPAVLCLVSSFVGQQVEVVTDRQHYGVEERWTYPYDGKGDCEDFAIAAAWELTKRGYSSNRMIIAKVRNARLEGHAVLIVDDRWVIDQYHPNEVRTKERSRYYWITSDPAAWVKVDSYLPRRTP